MPIGVDHIHELPVLQAKLLEMDADIDTIRTDVANIKQNVTINVTGTGFAVIEQPDAPPHPTSGTLVWKQVRAGSPDVFAISAEESNGKKIWLWFAETP